MYKTLVSFVMYDHILERTPNRVLKASYNSREPMEFIWDHKPTEDEIASAIKKVGDEEMGEIEVDSFKYITINVN